MIDIETIPYDRPVLIAGPTASGKTGLAIAIARAQGRAIVNADALQVYAGWRVLTARPTPAEEALAPHHLFGHVPFDAVYSTGQWLRDVTPLVAGNPVIVGGTGLYFRALTEGLAEIPPVAPDIRAAADALPYARLLAELDAGDPVLARRVDRANRARVQRGWEVLRATGRPLSDWQADTPPPLLPRAEATALLLVADRDWLNDRIARRFDAMLAAGALAEARANLPRWEHSGDAAGPHGAEDAPDTRRAGGARAAIGAPELIAHLQGRLSLDAVRDAAITASRRYAKRQRSWFRSNMGDWTQIALP